MKLTFTTLLILGCSAMSFAQNALPPAGNVGIGTSAPKTLLDVNGQAYIKEIGFNANTSFSPGYYGRRWFTQPAVANYTEFVETSIGGSAAFIFGGYTTAHASLSNTGTIKYAIDSGLYTAGAGMMQYNAHGGSFTFYTSPKSGGIGTDIQWLPALKLQRTQNISMYGNLDLTAQNPEIKLASINPTLRRAGLRGNNNNWIIGYTGVPGSEEISVGDKAANDNRSLSLAAGGKEQIRISSGGVITMGNSANPATSQIKLNADIALGGKLMIAQGSDGFTMRYDNDFFLANGDALVFEKTDVNQEAPDGGIAFTNKGPSGIPVAAMVIRGTGNIGIGTISPTSKLTVDGEIKATSVKVTANISLPDYVFSESYSLRKIDSVEAYIKENHHLPDVPSAGEVNRDGMELGTMNAVLLKKIEELTLYIIQQEKRIKALEQSHTQAGQ